MPTRPDRYSGVVILDTNCYQDLLIKSERDRILGSLRSVDLFIWPSTINAIQAAKHPFLAKRDAILGVIKDLANGRHLLPLPDRLLAAIGQNLLAGTGPLQLGETGFEWLYLDPSAIDPTVIAAFDSSLAAIDSIQESAFKNARPAIQSLGRTVEGGVPWRTIGGFLEEQWMTESQLADILPAESTRLGLPTALTFAQMMSSSTMRLFFEGFGAALFQRVLLKNEKPVVEATDLLQLPYLGARRRRIIVSRDKAFVQLSNAVLSGRHPQARAMTWDALAAAA